MLGKQKVDLGSGVSSNIREILNNALNGGEVSMVEGEALFNAKSKDRFAIYKVADEFRR